MIKDNTYPLIYGNNIYNVFIYMTKYIVNHSLCLSLYDLDGAPLISLTTNLFKHKYENNSNKVFIKNDKDLIGFVVVNDLGDFTGVKMISGFNTYLEVDFTRLVNKLKGGDFDCVT